MKIKSVLFTLIMGFSAAQASTINDICAEHTSSRKSLNVCLENAVDVAHLAACADATLSTDNTFKTLPFKQCLEIGQKRNLSINAIQNCEINSATHLGFTNCLSQSVETDRLAETN